MPKSAEPGATRQSTDDDNGAGQLLAAIPEIVNADAVLTRRGRFLTADVHVGVGALGFLLPIREGRAGLIQPATGLMRPWTFSVRASGSDWLQHWEDPAKAGWYDILGMKKRGAVTIEGDLTPFLQNLQFMKDVLASPRRAVGRSEAAFAAEVRQSAP
jgi:hypothetical protein